MTVLLEYIDLNEYNNYSLKCPFLLKCNDNLYTIIFLTITYNKGGYITKINVE